MTPTGVEQSQVSSGKPQIDKAFGAVSGAVDAELQFIINNWDKLPRDVRDKVLAMMKAVIGK